MRFLALSLNKLWIKSCCSVSGGLLSTTDISPPSAQHWTVLPFARVKHCGRVLTGLSRDGSSDGDQETMAVPAYSCLPQDSSRACHLHTCCPLDSFIAVQCLSSSSPELFRPKEIQPIISFLFMLRLLYTDSIRVTSESWNKATWKTKVSLYTGFGCPLRVDVLHLDISWPMEFSSVNLTYVSEGRKPTHHKYHLK